MIILLFSNYMKMLNYICAFGMVSTVP